MDAGIQTTDPRFEQLQCKESEDTRAEVTAAGAPRSSAVVDQVHDQVVRVLKARAELRAARLGAGADEEQLPVSDVAQVEAVVDLGDAAGSRQVLAKFVVL